VLGVSTKRAVKVIPAAIVLAASTGLIGSSPVFARSATPLFPSQEATGSNGLERRPRVIYLTPTDGALIAGPASINSAISWASWIGKSAAGSAEMYVDKCGCAADPDAPAAEFTITLSDPKRLDGYLIFSEMSYTHVKPAKGQTLSALGFHPGRTVSRVTYHRDQGGWDFGNY
jgi:uncharacterized protein YbjT (DUF2867 family)